jgi:hypothetical protein
MDEENDSNGDSDFHEEDDVLPPAKPLPLSSSVKRALVTGSKIRGGKSKKTIESRLNEADTDFDSMLGPGDLSSLSCNKFENQAIILRLDTKNKNVSFILKKK